MAKNEKELETLIKQERIYSNDVEMKCAMLIMKSGQRQMTKGTEQPNQEKSEHSKRGNLQILGDIEIGRHQTAEMIEKNYKRTPQKNEKTTRNQIILEESH